MSDLTALNLLLNASSKSTLEKSLNLTFLSRSQSPTLCVTSLKNLLELPTETEAIQLHTALLECIQVSLSSGSVEDLAELFKKKGKEVNPKLKQLIGQTITNLLDGWKEAAALGRVSLPRLVDFDWTLHMKKASNEISTMHAPSVIMALTVEKAATRSDELPDCQTIDFELSREALETVIDGLGKIRDQLSLMG